MHFDLNAQSDHLRRRTKDEHFKEDLTQKKKHALYATEGPQGSKK